MKGIQRIIGCAMLLGMISVMAVAQPNLPPLKMYPPVKNILKLSPFHLFGGTFYLSYERMIKEQKASLQFSAGLLSRNRRDWNTGVTNPEFGVLEEAQFRFYALPPQDFSHHDRNVWFFKGFYAGPYLSHRYLRRTASVWDWILLQNVDQHENIHEIGGGVILGVQIAIGNIFFVDFFTGGGLKHSFGQIRDVDFIGVTEPGYRGVYPKIGFQFGIGF